MATNHVQKKKLTNFLSSTRHAVATIIKQDMNSMKERLIYGLRLHEHTHTFKQIYFLLAKLYFPKGHLHIMYFICFHILFYAY